MKRKLARTTLVLTVLLLVAGGALFLWPKDRITKESWEKIRVGMRQKELETILGGPGISVEEWDAQHALRQKLRAPFIPTGVFLMEPDSIDHFVNTVGKVWTGRYGGIRIEFDERGHVSGKIFEGWRSSDPTFLNHVRDWLAW
jgi:hypothetical protein